MDNQNKTKTQHRKLNINLRENRMAIKNEQSIDTGNIAYKTQNEDKKNPHIMQKT